MADIPGEEVIADLVRMVRETRVVTEALTEELKLHKAEHTTIHPLLIELARASCVALDGAMQLNADAFDARTGTEERRLRSTVDDAFRAQQAVLRELQRMPPK